MGVVLGKTHFPATSTISNHSPDLPCQDCLGRHYQYSTYSSELLGVLFHTDGGLFMGMQDFDASYNVEFKNFNMNILEAKLDS